MRWSVGVARSLLVSAGLLGAGCHRSPNGSPESAPISVAFLSVGQGDCTVLQQGDEAILVDAGPKTPIARNGAGGQAGSGGFDAGERIVRRRLRELGVARVRGILLSHDDSDHTGGATAILRAFPAALAWTGPQSRIPIGPRVRRLPPEGRMSFGDLRLVWRYPASSAEIDNARSSLVAVEARGMRFALTGDSPTGVEEGVTSLANGTVDVYKAGHHGSKNSGSAALLNALRPLFVVVSCGAGNRYGHPHPDALARYRASGARVLRTDREGDIDFRWTSASGWELVLTPLDPTLAR